MWVCGGWVVLGYVDIEGCVVVFVEIGIGGWCGNYMVLYGCSVNYLFFMCG